VVVDTGEGKKPDKGTCRDGGFFHIFGFFLCLLTFTGFRL
jgi:hypothetical protein